MTFEITLNDVAEFGRWACFCIIPIQLWSIRSGFKIQRGYREMNKRNEAIAAVAGAHVALRMIAEDVVQHEHLLPEHLVGLKGVIALIERTEKDLHDQRVSRVAAKGKRLRGDYSRWTGPVGGGAAPDVPLDPPRRG